MSNNPGPYDADEGFLSSVPDINIKAEPGSLLGADILGRSFDVKRQISQSFQGMSGVSQGGILKPRSRRNSAYIKSDDDETLGGKDGEGNERKRRDNINEKIRELLTLIPEEYFKELNKELAGGDDAALKATGTRDGKPNKGQILTQAVEYIQHLQALIDENNRREVELILRMKTLQQKKKGQSNVPISVGTTSAEKALGEIGVGPESEAYFKKVLAESGNVTGGMGINGSTRDLS